MTDIFISYSRRDKAFVRALFSALGRFNRTAWIDWEDIAPAVEWEQSIYKGIENGNKFVFIISPDSVDSPYCLDEINHAIKHSKQFVPVLCRDTDLGQLHPEVSKFQIISFCGESSFEFALEKLLEAIDADLEHSKLYTRLKLRAEEWKKSNQHGSFLLRGTELASAEQWLLDSTNKSPKPSELHKSYIASSQDMQRQETQKWKDLFDEAHRQRVEAKKNEIKALCKSSEALFESGQFFDALVEGFKAGKEFKNSEWSQSEPEIHNQVISALHQAFQSVSECNRLVGHSTTVWNLSFSSNGTFASCDNDGVINIWNLDGTLIQTIEAHTDCISSIAFNRSGQILASASEDRSIKLWSTDGQLIFIFEEHKAEVGCVCFSPDGTLIASIDEDGIIKIWQINGTVLHSFKGHKIGNAISFSPNGKSLASGASHPKDKTLKIWDLNGTLQNSIELENGAARIRFHPEGQQLVAAGGNNAVVVKLDDLSVSKLPTEKWQIASDICFSQDGSLIVFSDSDGNLNVFKDKTLVQRLRQTCSITAVCFSPDGEQIISAGIDGVLRLWRLENILTKIFDGYREHKFYGLSFSPNGNTVATGNNDGAVRLWTRNGDLIKVLDGQQGRVEKVYFSPDGKKLASSSSDDETIFIRSSGGTPITKINYGNRVWDISFSPNSELIASAGADAIVKLWQLDGTLVRTFQGDTNQYIYSVCISPDGQNIAAGTSNRRIHVWDITGNLLTTLKGHARAVMSVSFSPNGQYLVSGCRDNTVKLWSREGKLINTLQGHSNFVWCVCFSADGQVIASASFDKTVKLWRLDGSLITTLRGHTEAAWNVAFSPNGQVLVSTGRDNKVIAWRWNLGLEELLEYSYDWLKNHLKLNPCKS